MMWPTDPSETGLAWAMPPSTEREAPLEASAMLRDCVAEQGILTAALAKRSVGAGPEAVHAFSGRAYDLGFGEDEARSWLRLAACLGSRQAQMEMGVLCAAIAASRDRGEAAGWRGLSRCWAEMAAGHGRKPSGFGIPLSVAETGIPSPGEVRRDMLLRWPWASAAAEAVEAAISVARMSGRDEEGLPGIAFVTDGSGEVDGIVPWLGARIGLGEEATRTRFSLDCLTSAPAAVRIDIPRPGRGHARRVAANAIDRHCRLRGLSIIDLPIRPDSLADMVVKRLLGEDGPAEAANRVLKGVLALFEGGFAKKCNPQ